MALGLSRRFYLLVNKNSKKCFLALGSDIQHLSPVVCYCTPAKVHGSKITVSMQKYLDKVAKADEFMKQQMQEFELGKKFLASIMGQKSKEMTQEDIDNAIEYLFPSALYERQARPLMKPPQELLKRKDIVDFDENGRPYHFLFYTLKPNFSECLHEAALILEKLNGMLYEQKHPPKSLILVGGKWPSIEALSEKFKERLFEYEYEKFLEIFNKLKDHPFAIEAEDFLKKYWESTVAAEEHLITPTIVTKDNVTISTIKSARKKTSTARVSVSSPGTGKISINNMGIDYFVNISPREQVLFPLLFSDMLKKVDVEATVQGGGDSSQSQAIRLGIARALQPFVSPDMFLEMKLAGLLQLDFRRRERKKPGREGARRGYTWLKR